MKQKRMQGLPINENAIQIVFTKEQKRLTETERNKKWISNCRLLKILISVHGRTKYTTLSQKNFSLWNKLFLWKHFFLNVEKYIQ